MDETVFLDGNNIGVGPQILELCRGQSSSKAVDDVPLVGDRTLVVTRESVEMGFTVGTILEDDNVSSGNAFLGLIHLYEGRRSRESGENAESEDDEALGEHVDDTGLYRRGSAES